jgi:adenylate kinase
VLFGPPGAGKGTQAALLKGKYEVAHVSTGDILREAVANRTEVGLKAKSYMDRGELVPDEVVIEIAKVKLSEIGQKGFILDGFPRTVPQAEALDKVLAEINLPLDAVVSLSVSDEELVKRLSGRRVCVSCSKPAAAVGGIDTSVAELCEACGGELIQRADDKPEAVRNRLQVYKAQTSPLIDYYRQRGLLKNIDATGTVEQVFERVIDALS